MPNLSLSKHLCLFHSSVLVLSNLEFNSLIRATIELLHITENFVVLVPHYISSNPCYLNFQLKEEQKIYFNKIYIKHLNLAELIVLNVHT